MGRMKGEGRVVTSVSVSPHFFELAKKHNIQFSEAMRIGLSLMFADRGECDYDNNLNLFRKMQAMRIKLEETSQQLAAMQEKYEATNNTAVSS